MENKENTFVLYEQKYKNDFICLISLTRGIANILMSFWHRIKHITITTIVEQCLFNC